MTVTVEQVADYLGASPADPNLTALLDASVDMIDDYLGAGVDRVPESVLDLATLQLSSELWVRRNSPGGVLQWSPDGSVPARLASDPMFSVYPMLKPYRGLGKVG